MAKHNKKLPQDVIDHWPEVLSDVKLEVIPIKYLHSVKVHFTDGKIWDIDLKAKSTKSNITEVEQSLKELLSAHEDTIEHIDFKLDTARIKNDITKQTTTFLKKKR